MNRTNTDPVKSGEDLKTPTPPLTLLLPLKYRTQTKTNLRIKVLRTRIQQTASMFGCCPSLTLKAQ